MAGMGFKGKGTGTAPGTENYIPTRTCRTPTRVPAGYTLTHGLHYRLFGTHSGTSNSPRREKIISLNQNRHRQVKFLHTVAIKSIRHPV